MLEYQKTKLSEKYADYILKLEPFLLKLSGYSAQDTKLKIDNYLLHCTPATFSLEKCQLLLSLGKNEVEYFKGFEQKLISLNLGFDSTYFGKPVSFYIKGRLENFDLVRDTIYMLNFSLNAISDTYKELFLYLSEMSNLYKKLYNTKLDNDQIEGLKKIPLNTIEISKDGIFICNAKLSHLSTRHLEIDLRQTNMSLEMEQNYNYVINYNNRPLKLSGKVVKSEDNQFISSIEYNIEYIHIISKYMNMLNKAENNQKSDTEELEEL